MVKKKDLVKILYIYICFCHVCPGHPCGDNPLRNFIFIAERTGRNLPSVLGTLQYINAGAFKELQREYQMYAECVGMVDTGYFKRSSSNEHNGYDPLSSKSEDESNLNDILRIKRKFENEIPSDGTFEATEDNSREQILKQTSRLLNDKLFQYLLSQRSRR